MKTLKTSPLKIFLLFFVICWLAGTKAQSLSSFIPSPDEPYLQKNLQNQLEFIYGKSFQSQATLLETYSFLMYETYKTLFPSSQYKKNSLIFASPRKQISNGLALVYPFPTSYIYSSPSRNLIDKSALNHWALDALSHEMSHIFQLNMQTRLSSLLSYLVPPYLWLVYPNIYLTHFVLEGQAVLQESIYGTGGRLFSGWARAFVLSQLRSGLTLKRVFNVYNDSFSSHEKYLHGGYFYSYLHRTHSLQQINQLFYNHSKNILFPIGIYQLNKLFKRTFDKNFYTLFKEYKDFYMPMALKQKSSSSPVLFESSVEAGMNSDKNNIFLLISDLKSPPRLVIMNKKTKKIKFKTVDMPLGKVFKIKKDYYSAGRGQTNTINYEVALFKEGYIPLQKSRSRYVLDKIKKTIIFFDSRQMLNELRLYVGNKFYDSIHSSAVLDSKGSVYYFKQNEDTRTLYKNKQALFDFKGYYGFPVEADEEGVYFISSTPYGSSLFAYQQGQVFRLSPSDTIISARRINQTEFLVSELSPSDYKYKVIPINKKKEKPYLYKYSFKKKNILKNISLLKKNKEKPYAYAPLENLRFKEWLYHLNAKKISADLHNNLELFSRISFTDPLQQNHLSLSGIWSQKKKGGLVRYTNTVHRLNWNVSYTYEESLFSFKNHGKAESTLKDFKQVLDQILESVFQDLAELRYKNNELEAHFLYPLIKTENWQISALSKWVAGNRIFEAENNWKFYWNNETFLKFIFERKYPYASNHHRKIEFNLFYESSFLKGKAKPYLATGFDFSMQREVGKGFYLSTSGKWNHTLQSGISQATSSQQNTPSPLTFHTLFFKQNIKDLKQIDLYAKKELNQSLYSLKFPASLRRWIPLVGLSFADLKKISSPQVSNYILHSFAGGEFDVALNYRIPLVFGVSGGLVWKWQNQFNRTKPRLHGGFYLKTKL